MLAQILMKDDVHRDVKTMKPLDKSLVTKLAVAVGVKLLVLSLIWWTFFREQGVTVDAKQVSQQLFSPVRSSDHKGEEP
jgi:hypothetical protein